MRLIFTLCLFLILPRIYAAGRPTDSSPLLRRMTISFEQQKLSQVLEELSNKGGFIFAYNGRSFNPDSLVNLKADREPVWQILDQLFKGQVDYKVHENYIILRLTFMQLAIYPENIVANEKSYSISGYVKDENTGRAVKQASVYDKKLLQSALTDNNGHFQIRFKGKHDFVLLTASKELYRDTMMIFLQDLKIAPEGYAPKPEEKVTSSILGKLRIGSFLLSSKQKIQSLNIPDFFAYTPIQASLTPGLSSHGTMSMQVVNRFSYNLLGGYTAGVSGMELGGLFNLNRGNVRYLQVAGLLNRTGGSVSGVQIAGLSNIVGEQVTGLQFAGLVNQVKDSLKGVQMAGLVNMTSKDLKGVQAAGISNHVFGTMRGFQFAGFFNYAKVNAGFQLGLVNVADSASGLSLGLVNLSRNGYHQLGIYSNELVQTGISFKSGTPALYSIFYVGMRIPSTGKLYTAGFGLGHDFIFSNRLALSAELSENYIYNGYQNTQFLKRFQTNFQVKLRKGLTVFAGPAYSLFKDNERPAIAGYQRQVAPDYAHRFKNGTKGWLGWNIGFSFL